MPTLGTKAELAQGWGMEWSFPPIMWITEKGGHCCKPENAGSVPCSSPDSHLSHQAALPHLGPLLLGGLAIGQQVWLRLGLQLRLLIQLL